MSEAKKGDKVRVHYTGKLANGMVFDSSLDREPLEFEIGKRDIIEGFEDGVIGMSPGESKALEIPVDKAYGPRNEELAIEIRRDQFPEGVEPVVGQQLESEQEDGEVLHFTVTGVTDSIVNLDANHPLAGRDLAFEIELVEIC